MRIRWWCVVWVVAGCFAGRPADGVEPAGPPVNVLLITVDTLRPDALGWVAGRNVTPNIDRLAREGFRFAAAVSPAPVTQPAHVSLFTGLVPRRHGVRDNGQVLGPGLPTLAEHLGQRGYATAAFVSGYPLAAEFGLDRGFARYDDAFTEGSRGRLERPAEQTTAAALAWLARVPEPWFLWVHYYDPHDPYTPPAQFTGAANTEDAAGDESRRAYNGEVRYVDQAIGTLRQGLVGQRGLAGQRGEVLTLFTADHGESLGEHGEQTHGFFLYDSTLAVPLVVHFPGRVVAGESAVAVRLIDLAPTALELLGLAPLSQDLDGVSLLPLLRGAAQSPRPAYSESRRPWLSYGWAPLRAVQHERWKLIAAPRPELYDLAADPEESRNLVDQKRAVARRLISLLRQIEARPAAVAASLGDPQALARLHTLGYVGAGADPGEPPPGLADPKDRLLQWDLLSRAMSLLEAGRQAEAVRQFDRALAEDPDNPFALSRSGAALLAAGQDSAAIPRLRRAVRLRPNDAESHRALAIALTRTGADAEAATEWMELARLQPRRTSAWVNLATSLGRGGKIVEAVAALERAVELAPERLELARRLALARYDLARIRAQAGDLQAARSSLRKALEAVPELRVQAEREPLLKVLLP
ncbi:MAG: sulfatase-like hydrolase/transferase [Acidobacteriota bacterium]